MWPFGRKQEVRADFTQVRLDAAFKRVSGDAGRAGALAVAEACVSLWERALSSATVMPDNRAMTGVTPQFLALAGRTLAVRGEIVAAIRVVDGQARIQPATSWDVDGGISSWFYRCDFDGPSASTTEVLPSDAVVHLRIGCEVKAPWRGRAPLAHGRETAALATAVEEALKIEALLPIGRIAPFAGSAVALQESGYGSSLEAGGVTVVNAHPLGSLGMSGGTGRESHKLLPFGPEPSTVMEALRTHAGHDICNAYGISLSFFSATGDGAGQRESWRRFWVGTVAPLGRVIETELRAKLDTGAMLSFEALRASDEDGRSRAVARRAAALKTLLDAGIERPEAMRISGLDAA